jgi:SAM-dependent methyltransferase
VDGALSAVIFAPGGSALRRIAVAAVSAVSAVSLAALAALLSPGPSFAQAHKQAPREFVPRVGQAGKDVIWVPTPDAVVKRMLDMARVGPNDYVVDLGAGDGRTVIAAAKAFGARALGIEYNPRMVEVARKSAAAAGVSGRAEFRTGDIFAVDFSRASVVTMYLLPELNLRLRPKILDMKPGTRVVSHSFNMAEWEPDRADDIQGHVIYFWIVPARIGGNWTLERAGAAPLALTWTQNFQKLQGTVKSGNDAAELRGAKLSGDRISFAMRNADGSTSRYSGRVGANSMAGTVRTDGAPAGKWSATPG